MGSFSTKEELWYPDVWGTSKFLNGAHQHFPVKLFHVLGSMKFLHIPTGVPPGCKGSIGDNPTAKEASRLFVERKIPQGAMSGVNHPSWETAPEQESFPPSEIKSFNWTAITTTPQNLLIINAEEHSNIIMASPWGSSHTSTIKPN